MRIVMVFPDPPLPFGGAGGREYYILLKGLVERGHRVTVFCGSADAPAHTAEVAHVFPPDKYDVRIYPHARNPRWNLCARAMTVLRPYSYMFNPDLRRDLQEELDLGYDALQLNQLWTGWVGMRYARRAVLHLHYLFSIDLSGGENLSWGTRLRRWMSCRAERYLLAQFQTIGTLTQRLADHVQVLNPDASVSVISTGLDLSLYEFEPNQTYDRPPTLGLIGGFDWEPTISAADRLLKRLWPEIKKQVPDAKLRIVGRRARQELVPWLDRPDVQIEEDVPDIKPYFRAIDVMLYAPRVGSGMKVKITESMALGTAVVTNADGVEGLNAVDGVHADVTDDDAKLIAAAVRLLKDPELRQRRRIEARKLVESLFDIRRTVEEFEVLYKRVMQNKA